MLGGQELRGHVELRHACALQSLSASAWHCFGHRTLPTQLARTFSRDAIVPNMEDKIIISLEVQIFLESYYLIVSLFNPCTQNPNPKPNLTNKKKKLPKINTSRKNSNNSHYSHMKLSFGRACRSGRFRRGDSCPVCPWVGKLVSGFSKTYGLPQTHVSESSSPKPGTRLAQESRKPIHVSHQHGSGACGDCTHGGARCIWDPKSSGVEGLGLSDLRVC